MSGTESIIDLEVVERSDWNCWQRRSWLGAHLLLM